VIEGPNHDDREAAMSVDLPVIAGALSTTIFALGTLPMLVKAAKTKDLSSYSLGNIVLSNVGNAIHSIYVFHLPMGPVWVLHSFYLVSTGLMLVWYVRYASLRGDHRVGVRPRPADPCTELPTSPGHAVLGILPDAATQVVP
jgi:uncharacterized protein with PQ loop repeat